MPEHLTPDQIEEGVVAGITILANDADLPGDIALWAIKEFRKSLAKNGYVFYQP